MTLNDLSNEDKLNRRSCLDIFFYLLIDIMVSKVQVTLLNLRCQFKKHSNLAQSFKCV